MRNYLLNYKARVLRILDDSGDGRLSRDEMMYGLKDYGVKCSKDEVEDVFTFLDTDKSGSVSFDEFLIGLRGPMSKRRIELILMAFGRLDRNNDGFVTMEDIEQVYDSSFHPDVKSGKLTSSEGLREFLAQFDSIEADGIVTEEEFIQYYKNVSSSIDNDDYFELMMRNAWHISGGKGQCANTSNLRVLVTESDGTEKVKEVENDLWLDRRNSEEIRRRLTGDNEVYQPKRPANCRANQTTINLTWADSSDTQVRASKRVQKHRKVRSAAAKQVQSIARAHLSRKTTQALARQTKLRKTLEEDQRREQEKSKPRIIRPKGKNWY